MSGFVHVDSPRGQSNGPRLATTFWREATKNFASKAVQRQQGEELIKLSGELETLSNSLNSKLDWNRALLVLSFALQLFFLGFFLELCAYGPVIPMARGLCRSRPA
jgi:hypothetical protein